MLLICNLLNGMDLGLTEAFGERQSAVKSDRYFCTVVRMSLSALVMTTDMATCNWLVDARGG